MSTPPHRDNIVKCSLVVCPFVLIIFFYRPLCPRSDVRYIERYVPVENTNDYFYVAYNGTNSESKNLIAILTRGENYTALGERIGKLDVRLKDNLSAHIMVFHNGYPEAAQIWEIHRFTKRRVILYNVDNYFLRFPNNFNPYSRRPNWNIRGKWSYHHMIHFWFKVVFELREVRNYEYMMRMDFDSQLLNDWGNVFDLMRNKTAVYMANFETLDYEVVLRGTLKLKKLVMNYINATKIIVQNPKQFQRAFNNESARTYWNNFEITQIKFFCQDNVTKWVNKVIESKGIYTYRWGDAILRYLTLAIFARKDQVIHREKFGFDYCHPC